MSKLAEKSAGFFYASSTGMSIFKLKFCIGDSLAILGQNKENYEVPYLSYHIIDCR